MSRLSFMEMLLGVDDFSLKQLITATFSGKAFVVLDHAQFALQILHEAARELESWRATAPRRLLFAHLRRLYIGSLFTQIGRHGRMGVLLHSWRL